MNKEDNLKEKFKQALISTIKVISDEYRVETELKKNLSSKNYNFFELDNLSSKQDYIKLRAETDSEALKRKFSNKEIYKKNLPKNSSCRSLYDITEKIRYELLGTKMLKGISKNLKENYNHKIVIKRKDQLKTREDVSISEAFELYMLKNFFDIKWLAEGAASSLESLYTQQYYNINYFLGDQKHVNIAVVNNPEIFESYRLSGEEDRNYSSSVFMVLALVKELKKLDITEEKAFKLILNDYWRKNPSKDNWKKVFQEVFNITLEDFYLSLKNYTSDMSSVLPSKSLKLENIFSG